MIRIYCIFSFMKKTTRFEIRLPEELDNALNEWRAKQDDVPNKAESARRLIKLALEADNIVIEKANHAK